MPDSVKRGDTPTLRWTLREGADAQPRDLTNVSARVIISLAAGATPVVDRAGVVDTPATAGIVSLALQAGDWAAGKLEAGKTYLVEIETTPGTLTHPSNGYERLTVLRDLG